MTEISIADITLRDKSSSGTQTLSFREKTEIAKQLDNLNVDVIETPSVLGGKTDVLFLHTISPIIKNSVISCPTGLTVQSVSDTYDAVKRAAKPRLNIMIPVSTVQMEYICNKKPDKVLEMTEELVKHAASLCSDIEVSFTDSTRAEKDFLYKAVKTAIDCGAGTITLCDSAGVMLPAEFEAFLSDVYKNVPELSEKVLSVECSDGLSMAVACAISCINAGVRQIKTAVGSQKCPSLCSVAQVFREKSAILGIKTGINMATLENSVKRIELMTSASSHSSSTTERGVGISGEAPEDVKFSSNDDIKTVSNAVSKMGYDLSDEDMKNVYDEFLKIASKKTVGTRELDAIVASAAMQVSPTYKLKSYVINSGNIMTPTSNIELYRDGEVLHGFCVGDGPIDASFLAIEQITGHHYELDDFRIQTVTGEYEAMGESVVKLRFDGKLYSGKGTSTDIVGASINAYINALNKICFEEECR